MLSNAYFLAKFRFDTAENEPAKNLQNFAKFSNFADPNPQTPAAPRGPAARVPWEVAGPPSGDSRTGGPRRCVAMPEPPSAESPPPGSAHGFLPGGPLSSRPRGSCCDDRPNEVSPEMIVGKGSSRPVSLAEFVVGSGPPSRFSPPRSRSL